MLTVWAHGKIAAIAVGRPLSFTTVEQNKVYVWCFFHNKFWVCQSCGTVHSVMDNLFRRLQSIQNTAVRPLTGTERCDHISPVLSCLHWQPVKQRVVFKLAIVVLMVKPCHTGWMTAILSLILDAAIFAHLTPMPSMSCILTLGLETTVFWWQDWKYGTVFLLHCDRLTLNLGNSNDF